jgi:ATP-dependent RNA helicase DeaD
VLLKGINNNFFFFLFSNLTVSIAVSQLLKQDKQIIVTTTSNISLESMSNYRQTLYVKLPPDPKRMQTFSDMILLKELLKNITDMGFLHPTTIQRATIEPCAQGQSMIVHAPSSTGKTTAICISVLQRLLLNKLRTQVCIITSSDKVTMKISSLLRRLILNCPCKILQCTADPQQDLLKLKRGYRCIVVGTVWQIKNLLLQNKSCMIHLKIVVLVPADVIMEQPKSGE